jgi:LysR family transcriptional activator of nhaA
VNRLNYNHLLYFRAVAKAGSFSAAGRQLQLSQPTVSEQIHTFERTIGRKLFRRVGNSLELTAAGKLVLRYAEKIFRLGDELRLAIRNSKLDKVRRQHQPSAKSRRIVR